MSENVIELILLYSSTALLLLFIAKKVWPGFIKSVEDRKNQINNDLEQAEVNKNEAIQNKNEYAKELSDLQTKKSSIINETIKVAKDEKNVIIVESRKQAKEIINKAREEALNEQGQIEKDIRKNTLEYVNLISEKFIQDKLSSEDELKMFEDAIKEAK